MKTTQMEKLAVLGTIGLGVGWWAKRRSDAAKASSTKSSSPANLTVIPNRATLASTPLSALAGPIVIVAIEPSAWGAYRPTVVSHALANPRVRVVLTAPDVLDEGLAGQGQDLVQFGAIFSSVTGSDTAMRYDFGPDLSALAFGSELQRAINETLGIAA